MKETNIPGSIIITAILLVLVGYAISRAVSLDWILYFKVAGSIAALALITAILAGVGSEKKQH
ncbi:MAG: hypothetical protein QXI19_03415 [Candidatus Caldarchaeum sp.]